MTAQTARQSAGQPAGLEKALSLSGKGGETWRQLDASPGGWMLRQADGYFVRQMDARRKNAI